MTTPSSIKAFQAKLAGKTGPLLWRSLEELAGTPEFRAWLEREFPVGATEWPEADAIGRRKFLGLLGASLALAGLAGCSRFRVAAAPVGRGSKRRCARRCQQTKPPRLLPGGHSKGNCSGC
jgi:MoCo/4Fe-4S cofactor protein with predicted Tat translocation signal